jgi:transcriptional regulator with XRE-family HTH domain
MRDIEFGRAVRRLRHRRRWRQEDLARAAGVSRQAVSRLERGALDGMPINRIREIGRPLELAVDVVPRWHGGDLVRIVSERHATLTAGLLGDLRQLPGWEWFTEVTFTTAAGERGSADAAGWREADHALIIYEVKPDLIDPHGHVSQLDRYRRAAGAIAASIGVRPRTVAIVLAADDTTTNRRRRHAYAPIYDTAFPDPVSKLRDWLRTPDALPGDVPVPGRIAIRLRCVQFIGRLRGQSTGARTPRVRVGRPPPEL